MDACKVENLRPLPGNVDWNVLANPFFAELAVGIESVFRASGLVSLMAHTAESPNRQAEMLNLAIGDAGKPFAAGEVAMHFWSTSAVGAIERAKGGFELHTSEYPGMGEPPKGLPAGGNSGMLVSTSDDPKQVEAAWTFLKFCTSGLGAAAVAETTGYMPPNKAANELLADFYANKHTAARQAGLLRDWIAYPGDNGLAGHLRPDRVHRDRGFGRHGRAPGRDGRGSLLDAAVATG